MFVIHIIGSVKNPNSQKNLYTGLYYYIMKSKIEMFDYTKAEVNVKIRTLKECLLNKILTEVYQKSDKTRFLQLFHSLKDYLLDKISEEDFNTFLKREHFRILRIPEGLSGYYENSTNTICLLFDSKTLNSIASSKDSELQDIVDYIWTAFVHEDTHHQQQLKVAADRSSRQLPPLKVNKHYIKYDDNLPYDLSINSNVQYFSNPNEIDALAREVGEKIKLFFNFDALKNEVELHRKVREVFETIKKDDFQKKVKNIDFDEIKKVVNIYWDPRISKKAKMEFFGTLYEYLYTI